MPTTSMTAPASAGAVRDLLAAPTSPFSDVTESRFASLKGFYADRGYEPLWLDPEGPRTAGRLLLGRLAQIDETRRPTIEAMAGRGSGAALELQLSAAYAETAINRQEPASAQDGSAALIAAAGASDLAAFLRATLPVDPTFWRLRASIGVYREIAERGGWLPIAAGSKLEVGARDPRVGALRRRLLVTGDIANSDVDTDRFDLRLTAAVRTFQARHGLEPDGIVGAKTLAALNVPIEGRLATMEGNLSRMLEEERDWGARYVAVNAAAATYKFVEGGQSVFVRPAIVGQPGWPTPRIDSVIDRLEFHPFWTVPPRIAALEIWPKVRRDSSYLRRNHMRIVDGQIRQDPGPDNPLGIVKFIFANSYSVFLHDTNHPELFARANRFRSHGCIRISGALELARALLKDNADWPEMRIAAAVAGGRNIKVDLASPISIHIVYDTAWVDDGGVVQFRDDVYRRDRRDAAAVEASSLDAVQTCRDWPGDLKVGSLM